MADRRVIALTEDRALRVVWIEADDIVAEVIRRHRLSGRAASLAAELTVANLLLAVWTKGAERVSLQLQGQLPRVAFHGQAGADGGIRARLTPSVLSGEEALVEGMMLAIKDDGRAEMYRGVTPVHGEHVADALQRHLAQSDQLAARVRISLEDTRVRGLLVEVLPESDSEGALSRQAVLPAWAEGSFDGLEAGLEAGALGEVRVDVVEELPLRFRCACSRERVQGMLTGLGAEELVSMRDEDGEARVTCEFCREDYRFDVDALDGMIASLRAPQA